ncbi:hypothetical protein N657DRAFT_645017, partial [Parathielavia appendiculata]
MSRTTTVRKYGRTTRKPRAAEVLFAQLPRTPVKSEPEKNLEGATDSNETEMRKKVRRRLEEICKIKDAEEEALSLALGSINLRGGAGEPAYPKIALDEAVDAIVDRFEANRLAGTSPFKLISALVPDHHYLDPERPADGKNKKAQDEPLEGPYQQCGLEQDEQNLAAEGESLYDDFRVLTWDDVCPAGDRIEKIAEASYAEVYRITNAHGTSIIKVIRLESPIRAQTKAQERAGLVDEEPHSEGDMQGEQAFHRRKKRQDPDMLQFYPSPSRYLDDTRFLVVELGDAGTALEDFELTSIRQVWDIFLHTALALTPPAQHRDLHEGNICIRQVRPSTPKPTASQETTQFGLSGLDVTILDYGLSRATDPKITTTTTAAAATTTVAADLEKDLTLFQSTHAPQCRVYRQMRSYLIHADRLPLIPASHHTTPYPISPATGQPISWTGYYPYTNVLWLAYLYGYLVTNFRGDRAELRRFKVETRELRAHLDPSAHEDVLNFPSAGEVVRFAVEAGWIEEAQVVDGLGEGSSMLLGAGVRENGEGDCGEGVESDGEGKTGGEECAEARRDEGDGVQEARPVRKTRRRKGEADGGAKFSEGMLDRV